MVQYHQNQGFWNSCCRIMHLEKAQKVQPDRPSCELHPYLLDKDTFCAITTHCFLPTMTTIANVSARYIEKESRNSIAEGVLTIDSVSDHDLSTTFTCFGKSLVGTINKTVTLVRRGQCWVSLFWGIAENFDLVWIFFNSPQSLPVCSDSYLSTAIVFACVFFAATLVLVKCFALDLVLLFRPWISWICHGQGKTNKQRYIE